MGDGSSQMATVERILPISRVRHSELEVAISIIHGLANPLMMDLSTWVVFRQV